MGVIKRNKTVSFNSSDDTESIDSSSGSNITFSRFLNSNRSTSISESTPNTLINPVIVSSEDEQTNSNSLLDFIESELRRSRRSSNSNKKRKICRPSPTFVCLGTKGKSDRKRKRYENANLHSNPYFSLNDADIYREIDIYDFVPKSLSPFSILLMDQNNMKIWNDFIRKSEDEQEIVLKELDDDDKPKNRFKKGYVEENQEDDCKTNDDEQHQLTPSKSLAHSAKKCFNRINSCLKSVLKRKIPLSLMESIEQELIVHFKDQPTSIYQTCLDSSYARLLLHACAQYYDLNCRSFDSGSNRLSQVSNKWNHFEPSIVSLTDHLEKLYIASKKS